VDEHCSTGCGFVARLEPLIAINYYTARVSGRVDKTAPARQHTYLRALGSLPLVSIHYGNFLTMQKWSGLVHPPQFRPEFALPAGASPHVAYVWKTEEKGSDVNLGVHLVRYAFTHAFDEAAVLTNDTDLVEPIRIATQEYVSVKMRDHLNEIVGCAFCSRLT
jgi:uncharacterized LabA/DUF88 family protein